MLPTDHRGWMRGALLAAFALGASPAFAEVVDSAPTGFELRETAHIAAPPAKVYAALTAPSHWWNSAHTYSGSAANLSLEAKAGGCFCEALPGGGSVEHAVVVAVMPGKMLRLRGPLGPFQGWGVDGALTWTLAPSGNGTELTVVNDIGGYVKGGFGDWAAKADAMLGEQVTRLQKYVETGSPEPK